MKNAYTIQLRPGAPFLADAFNNSLKKWLRENRLEAQTNTGTSNDAAVGITCTPETMKKLEKSTLSLQIMQVRETKRNV